MEFSCSDPFFQCTMYAHDCRLIVLIENVVIQFPCGFPYREELQTFDKGKESNIVKDYIRQVREVLYNVFPTHLSSTTRLKSVQIHFNHHLYKRMITDLPIFFVWKNFPSHVTCERK